MSKIAFLFPGQGSQYPGMGRVLAEKFNVARETLREADEAVGMPLSRMIMEGAESELERPAITQPCVLAISIAYFRVLAELGFRPDIVAGHSLGEYSALVANGALDFGSACRLVHQRGRWMEEAVLKGEGAMAAVTGGDTAEITALIQHLLTRFPGSVLQVSAINCPGQAVLSGDTAVIHEAVGKAQEFGIGRASLLRVGAPFHCRLMKPVEEKLHAEVEKIHWNQFKFPYVANVTASMVDDPKQTPALLVEQLCACVDWHESTLTLWEWGARHYFEVGPGRVLGGLVRRSLRKVTGDAKPVIESCDQETGLSPAVIEHLEGLTLRA